MKTQVAVAVLALVLVACQKKTEVEVDTTRPLTTEDQGFRVDVSSAERFLPPQARESVAPKSSDWNYVLPEGWRDAGPRTMRAVNLAFGEDGETYVSVSGGDVQANIDRWYRQFGAEPKAMESLSQVDFMGGKAWLVEAEGRYEPGMGRPGKDNQGLLGVMAEREGALITVKMIGPSEEVTTRREQFLQFTKSLKRN